MRNTAAPSARQRLWTSISICLFVLAVSGNARAQTNTFPTSGNAGIGTTSPGYPLTVESAPSADPLVQALFRSTSTSYPYGGIAVDGTNQSHVRFMLGGALKWQWRVGAATGVDDLRAFSWALGADVLTLKNNGNVGIGTTSPSYRLDVQGAAGTFFPASFTISGGSSYLKVVGANGSAYDVGTMFTDGTNSAYIGMLRAESGLTGSLDLFTGGAVRASVSSTGNVGIGIAPSTYKLDVNGNTNVTGNLNVTGNINAKYQDVAEWVPSSEQFAAGSVVVLDATKSNQVIASSTAYDTRVAGVISAQPGITLGEKSDSKVLVATTGRVRVKVDATKAPINIGDLLVTSDIPGVAMKSEPIEFAGRKMHMPGTIIGKALEPLAKGKGEILVLLSLQ